MNRTYKTCGFSLVEVLITVLVISILTGMVVLVASRIDAAGKENLTQSTVEMLSGALEEFREFGYRYRNPAFRAFTFPIDCNGYDESEVRDDLSLAMGLAVGDVVLPTNYKEEYSGIGVMCFMLGQVPAARESLEKISPSLMKKEYRIGIVGTADTIYYPFVYVVDGWGKALRYDYYDEGYNLSIIGDLNEAIDRRRNFPLIISAGKDGVFGTDDDIKNR